LDVERIRRMAAAVATLSMDAVEKARSGHPGMPMGMAEAATVLWTRHLKHDPEAPDWPDRDRFVLSAGHGSMLLYSLLFLSGYPGWSIEDLKAFRQLGSKTAGHPEFGHGAGIETTTGPLGQGLGNAVGMAIAEAHLRARYGEGLVDHRTWTIAGDGCLMEGISQESISLAGHLRLSKLCVLWDDNGITIDGAVSMADSTDQRRRFEASGWHTLACDGHDPEAVDAAIEEAKRSDRPTLIACRTVIGRGTVLEGTAKVHGSPLGEEGVAAARKSYGWTEEAFAVPGDVIAAWREGAGGGAEARAAWERRAENDPQAEAFRTALAGEASAATEALAEHARGLAAEGKRVATRKASENALGVINQALPFTLGGSADLTGSNNTKTEALGTLTAETPEGRYLHYGIREHGMAAAMNGMALHGGVLPYGGTFLVFADYMRPSMRLAALMGQRVVYVLTHDSIGLGEDGPTHQPVETLASLRAIPNMVVLRPGDAVETAEAWAVALGRTDGPTVLALTRQDIGPVRGEAKENRTARGAYVLREVDGAQASIVATGSEVEIALQAADRLAQEGVPARVVSMPSLELFAAQDEAYRRSILGRAPRVAVEAGVRQGWDRILHEGGVEGAFVGMDGFGASGPYKDLYEHFGITSAKVAEAVRSLTRGN
jgi:transketolase